MIAPLLVDAYQGDDVKLDDWTKLALVGPPWCGAILKASEGTTNKPEWFVEHWQKVKSGGGPRYGIDWFRGAYHYLRVKSSSPVTQAETYLAQIEAAGGWSDGDLWPILDVERAGNDGASKTRVRDAMGVWALKILSETGRAPMLYGGSFLRDLGISDARALGFQLLWVPRYTATLPPKTYTALGFDLSSTWAWQYIGDGDGALANYPHRAPIGQLGQLDISAVIINGGNDYNAAIEWTRTHLGTRPT